MRPVALKPREMLMTRYIAYIRTDLGTSESAERQKEAAIDGCRALSGGAAPDAIYADTASGRTAILDRPSASAMIESIQPGDTVVVVSLDRLGRRLSDVLVGTHEILGAAGALHVLDLGLTFQPGNPAAAIMAALYDIGNHEQLSA